MNELTPSIASQEGISFANSSGILAGSGAAFVLNHPSPVSAVLPLSDGWLVELRKGSRSIVVRGNRLNRYNDALSIAVSKAQRALDWLSIQRIADLEIHLVDEDHVVWWTRRRQIVLRMTLLVTEVAGRFAASGTDDPNPLDRLTDQPLDWHRSFRYFRLAQTTDDTFDAFRNLFLALESALGDIRPMQEMFDGKREPEGVWLRAALNTVAQRISLEQFARPGNGNPESRIFNEIYKTRRNPVFHAKSIRNPFLPGEYRDRIALAESLRRLTGLYLAIATAYLGLRHPQSEGVLSIMLQGLMRQDSGLRVYVSDLTEHLHWEVVASRSLEDRVVLLETKRARDLATESAKALYVPFTTSFFAQSPVKELSHLSGITQIWTSEGDEQPVLGFILDGSGLTLGGIAHLEVHLGLRLTQPKWGRDVYTH